MKSESYHQGELIFTKSGNLRVVGKWYSSAHSHNARICPLCDHELHPKSQHNLDHVLCQACAMRIEFIRARIDRYSRKFFVTQPGEENVR